jgi:hypothetical protein
MYWVSGGFETRSGEIIMDAFIFTVGCLISLTGFSFLTLATVGLI